jgi:hypothetical protein
LAAGDSATLGSRQLIPKAVDVRNRSSLVLALLSFFPAAAFALGIESVTLRADDGGEPGEEVEVFIATDHKQHFDIKLDEAKVGNNSFLVEFWAVDISAGQNIKVTEWSGSGLLANTLKASVNLPRDWPVGQYRLDVKHEGKIIGSHEYEILEPVDE